MKLANFSIVLGVFSFAFKLENSQSLEVMGNGRLRVVRQAAEDSVSEPEAPTEAPNVPQNETEFYRDQSQGL